MKILINDANILIDLVKLDLLEIFSKISFDLFSTDFVLEELKTSQRKLVEKLVNSNELTIIETIEVLDFQEISSLLENTSGLSFVDCSVLYYSKKMEGTLLTGDGRLRKQAKKDNVDVRGIIYIFDELVEQELLTKKDAATKIEELAQLNARLPKDEIEKRIKEWEK